MWTQESFGYQFWAQPMWDKEKLLLIEENKSFGSIIKDLVSSCLTNQLWLLFLIWN